jgi:hypothetical protein
MSVIADGLRLTARGFVIVILTATNVYQIAHEHYAGAFVVGTLISVVWFTNAKSAGHSEVPCAKWWYGIGAGLGTIAGMSAMQWWYGQ